MALACLLVMGSGCLDLGFEGGTAPDAAPEVDSDMPATGDGGLVRVVMSGLRFTPGSIDIVRGTTVQWTNHDAVAHTVTEGDPSLTTIPAFDSPILATGQSFRWRFDQPGTWIYYCRTHPNVMRGNRVNVR